MVYYFFTTLDHTCSNDRLVYVMDPSLASDPPSFFAGRSHGTSCWFAFFSHSRDWVPSKNWVVASNKNGGGSEVIGVSPSHHPFYFRIFHEINHPAIKGIPYRWNPPNTHCKIFVGLPRYHLGHVSNYWQTLDGESFLPPKWWYKSQPAKQSLNKHFSYWC